MIRSSANALIETPAGRFSLSASSTMRFHWNGDRTLPWGHPFAMLVTNSVSYNLKVAVLSLKKLWIQLIR